MIIIEKVSKRECERCGESASIKVKIGDAEFIVCDDCAKNLQEALKIHQKHNNSHIVLTKTKRVIMKKSKIKTMLEDFLEKHPKAMLYNETGTPTMFPIELGYCGAPCGKECKGRCNLECWHKPLEV